MLRWKSRRKKRRGSNKSERKVAEGGLAWWWIWLFVFKTCTHLQTHTHMSITVFPVSFALCRAMRIRVSVCHQNEGRKYAKQTIRGVPPGAKQPIMAVPVCVTSQQEAELVLVSSQSPAEWLISLLDWRGDRMLKVQLPIWDSSAPQTKAFLYWKEKLAASLLLCECDTLIRTIYLYQHYTHSF